MCLIYCTESYFIQEYFDLIHSDISPPVLEEMFAIDRPLLQFKQGFLEIEDGNITTYLSQLGEEESVRLLEGTVIISGPVGSELAELEGPFSASKEGNFAYSIERYDYNSLLMRVDSESDGLLYWADGYDQNWHAFVDGVEVPVYRANIAFKAIQLPEGESEVSFVYDPFWFKIGLYVFFGLEIVCLLGFLIGLRKQSAGGVLR